MLSLPSRRPGHGATRYHRRGDQLVCLLDSGIGNRILHLASSMRVAEKEGRELLAYWNTSGIGCSAEQVFEPIDGVRFQSPSRLPWRDRHLQSGSWLHVEPGEVATEHRSHYPGATSAEFCLGIPARGFKRFYRLEWVSDSLKASYLPFFARICFHPDILAEAEAALQPTWQDVECGVHVRAGADFIHKLQRSNLAHHLEPQALTHTIRQCLRPYPRKRIYLATDTPGYQEQLSQTFGKRVLYHRERTYNRGSKGDLYAALTDMVLLSRCPRLLLSISSFGASAWWLGGCKPAIRLDGPRTAPQEASGKTPPDA
jgi:hypothetical protein